MLTFKKCKSRVYAFNNLTLQYLISIAHMVCAKIGESLGSKAPLSLCFFWHIYDDLASSLSFPLSSLILMSLACACPLPFWAHIFLKAQVLS